MDEFPAADLAYWAKLKDLMKGKHSKVTDLIFLSKGTLEKVIKKTMTTPHKFISSLLTSYFELTFPRSLWCLSY